MEENENVWELTPEQAAILDELSESVKQDGLVKFQWDETFQRKLLSGLLQDNTLSAAIPLIETDYFPVEVHKWAFGILKKFWTQSQHLPTKFIVMQELENKLKEKPADIRLLYAAEIETIYTYYVPGMPENQYILNTIFDWCKRLGMAMSIDKLMKKMDDGKLSIGEAFQQTRTAFADIDAKINNGDISDSWNETFDKQEAEDWLIPNWLEFGSLGMLSGDPFSGKSHLLAGISAAIFKGDSFGRYIDVPKCAVIFIDAENKRRILVKRILAAFGEGDKEPIQKLFRRIDPTRLKFPLAVDGIRDIIRREKAITGQQRAFVIIDTMRSVLGADEMEVSEMVKVLYPLQRVAQEENAAILLLHHRPKSGATYSGQTSIAGACDYLWLWESDRATGIGQLELVGTRGETQPRMKFILRNGRNEWIPDGDNLPEKENNLVGMVEDILKDGELKQADVVKQIQNLWPNGQCPGRDKLIVAMQALVGSVVNVRKGKDNASFYSLISGQETEN